MKTLEVLEESPELATTFCYYCLDLATAFINKSQEGAIVAFETILEFFILAFEKSFEWLIKGCETFVSSLEYGVTYYKDNQKNPRLFSNVLKQMIH